MSGQHLASALTITRLSLHVLGATVWVGGQLTVAGLLSTVRRLGEGASRKIAAAFGRLQWPAYGVLVATGIWNVFAVHAGRSTGSWQVVLWVKIAVVALAGLSALLHQRARSTAGLAVWGAVAGTTSLAALVLGVALAG